MPEETGNPTGTVIYSTPDTMKDKEYRKKPLFSCSADEDGIDEDMSSIEDVLNQTSSSTETCSSFSSSSSSPPQKRCFKHGESDRIRTRASINERSCTCDYGKENTHAAKHVIMISNSSQESIHEGSSSLGYGFQQLAESLTDYLCPIDSDYKNLASNHWMKGCCAYCDVCQRQYCLSCAGCYAYLPSGNICQDVVKRDVERVRKHLQIEICSLMGSSSFQAQERLTILKDWLLGFAAATGAATSLHDNPDNVKSILVRNRAHVLRAQEKRIMKLRNEMHHMSLNAERYIAPIPTTRSFDDRMYSKGRNKLQNYTNDLKKRPSKSFLLSAISGNCVDSVPSFELSKEEDEKDFCYDSDPGRPRKSCHVLRRPRDSNVVKLRPLFQGRRGSLLDEQEYCDFSTIEIKNDELVIQFTKELANGNISLVWHPCSRQNSNNLSPVCVQAWFEMGCRLRDRVIQPKFMWWTAYQPDLSRNKLNISNHTPESIELLNIVRVLKPNRIDRELHPFAILKNSFTLQTNTNEIFLFEALKEDLRDRFVQGLKLVVARLASKIIVGDEDVFEEFFTPWGQSISPKGLSETVVTTDSDSSEDSLEFEDVNEDIEIFRASPVFNR